MDLKEKLTEEDMQLLLTKKHFVEELSETISKYIGSVHKLDYDVFTDEDGITYEYLVITYRGGAIAVRDCEANSLSAIFIEASALLNGGYYDEVKSYRALKATAVPIEGLTCDTLVKN